MLYATEQLLKAHESCKTNESTSFTPVSFSLHFDYCLGGAVVQWVEHWTCNQQVVGSNPNRGKAA